MKNALALFLSVTLLAGSTLGQTSTPPQQQPVQTADPDEEVLRITTELVQVDAVVVDKNDRIVTDLKREDFDVFENGKKQDIKFIEFVSVDAERRREGARPDAVPSGIPDAPTDLTKAELKRAFAFVVDDLTTPAEDMVDVRRLLTDFVENKMRPGDLVAIVRTVSGKGLLQQFTTDRQLLRRAIASLTPRTSPFSAFSVAGADPVSLSDARQAAIGDSVVGEEQSEDLFEFTDPNDDTVRTLRATAALGTASFIIDSLRELPGRKNLVLISGGLPIYAPSRTGSVIGNISYLFNQLTDKAVRSGVVINTLDIRGLEAAGAVARFADTPGRSASGVSDGSFGRVPDAELLGETRPFDPVQGQIGLRTLANNTGGIAVVNTNNFRTGLDRIVARSSGYYLLAFTPTEKFDGKFHKLQIKVKRDGLRLFKPEGYFARNDRTSTTPRTKEDEIAAAARSPLSRRDIDVAANLLYKFLPDNRAALDIQMLIDAKKLNFTQTEDGRQKTSFDVVGFIFDQVGQLRGGFSQTVNTNLSTDEYKRALATGLGYEANTQLPPGYYQLRAVVRETGSKSLGTLSRYFEIPNLANKRLAMSSLFLYEVAPSQGTNKEAAGVLPASRRVSRNRDLRYAAVIYNPKVEGNKPQLRTQMIISQGNKILYQEPEQPVTNALANGQIVKIGQLGLSKVSPGRYVLTLRVTDPLTDKKNRTIARSIDFTVVD